MEQFRFREDSDKVLGAGDYSIDNEEIGSLHYTGLYRGNEIVALLVSEWSEDSTERMFALGDFIVRACNSHEQLVAALRDGRVAIDVLMAQLIEVDPSFLPTKSAAWPALVAIKAALEAAEAA